MGSLSPERLWWYSPSWQTIPHLSEDGRRARRTETRAPDVVRDPVARFHKLFALAVKGAADGERASARRRVVELLESHSAVNWLALVPRAHRGWAFAPIGPTQEDCRTCYFLMSGVAAFCMRHPEAAEVVPGASWCGEWRLHPDGS